MPDLQQENFDRAMREARGTLQALGSGQRLVLDVCTDEQLEQMSFELDMVASCIRAAYEHRASGGPVDTA